MSQLWNFLNANPALLILIVAVIGFAGLSGAFARRSRALARQLKRENDAALHAITLLSQTLS